MLFAAEIGERVIAWFELIIQLQTALCQMFVKVCQFIFRKSFLINFYVHVLFITVFLSIRAASWAT